MEKHARRYGNFSYTDGLKGPAYYHPDSDDDSPIRLGLADYDEKSEPWISRLKVLILHPGIEMKDYTILKRIIQDVCAVRADISEEEVTKHFTELLEEPTEERRNRLAKKFNTGADASVYEPRAADVITLGPLKYVTSSNELYVNDELQAHKKPNVLRTFGLVMSEYPYAPTTAEISKYLTQKGFDASDAFQSTTDFSERLKKRYPETFSHKPLFDWKDAQASTPIYRISLCLELKDLEHRHDEETGLVKFDSLTLLAGQNMAWVGGKPLDLLRNHNHTPTLAFLIKNRGRIITPDEMQQSGFEISKDNIATLNKFLKQIIHETTAGAMYLNANEIVFYENAEQQRAILEEQRQQEAGATRNKRKKIAIPENAIKHGLWMLCPDGLNLEGEEQVFFLENGEYQYIDDLDIYELTMLGALIESAAEGDYISREDMDFILFSGKDMSETDLTQAAIRRSLKEKLGRRFNSGNEMITLQKISGQYSLLPYRPDGPKGSNEHRAAPWLDRS